MSLLYQPVCGFCHQMVDTGGRFTYPPYTWLGACLFLSGQDFLCRPCLDALGLTVDLERRPWRSVLRPTKPAQAADSHLHGDGRSTAHLQAVHAAGPYEGALKALLIRFKYGGERELAAPLAKLMHLKLLQAQAERATPRGLFSRLLAPFRPLPYDLLIPVPLHKTRLLERGYNQSALLAGVLSAETGLPRAELLRRARETRPLKAMAPARRSRELAGAFAYIPSAAPPVTDHLMRRLSGEENVTTCRILLIDDIYTTGATAAEIARVLGTGLVAGTPFERVAITVLTVAR